MWSFSANAPTRNAGPVVSPTGAIIVVTDYGTVYRLDSNAGVLSNYPIQLGQQITGSPASITNPASDYFVVGYGNTLTAFTSANASSIWSVKTQTPGELYRGSVSTDGINIFMASTNKKVYCYVAETGVLNWVYTISSSQTAPFTPYAISKNIGITLANDSNIIILSNTTVRSAASDIIISIPGIQIASPPVISTDPQGGLWAHVITSTGVLYGFGGLFPTPTYDGYQYVWSNVLADTIPASYQVPIIDSAGYIYASSVYGSVNQYYAYYTGGATHIKNTSLIINGTETVINPPIQVSLTPLIMSQNTIYIIGRDISDTSPKYGTNYVYTLSGPVVDTNIRVPTLVFAQQRRGLPTGVVWSSVASSDDGRKLAICGENALYTSINYGIFWTQRIPEDGYYLWKCIASSSDGMKLVAITIFRFLYISSDGGVSWEFVGRPFTSFYEITSIVSSSNGMNLAVTGYAGSPGLFGFVQPYDRRVYTSSDGGRNWEFFTEGLPDKDSGATFDSIASSSDGIKLAICDSTNGTIYTSSDTGVSWTRVGLNLPVSTWTSITSSTNGTNLAICSRAGLIYTSLDTGVNWIQAITGLPVGTEWVSIASSADGLKLAVCGKDGTIYTSLDRGSIWTKQTNGVPVGVAWKSIASSYSGTNLALVSDNGIVCTGYQVL